MFVLDEEMQIMLGKRRMLNVTTYDISGQFGPQTETANVDINGSFAHKTLLIMLLR